MFKAHRLGPVCRQSKPSSFDKLACKRLCRSLKTFVGRYIGVRHRGHMWTGHELIHFGRPSAKTGGMSRVSSLC